MRWSVSGAFHIHPDEVGRSHAGGLSDQGRHLLVSEIFVEVETHMRELEADVGVEAAGPDFVEQLMIELGAGPGFVGAGDVFAEVVDGNGQVRLIDGGGGAQDIFDLGAGNKAAGEAASERRAFGDRAQSTATGQRNEESPQHGGPARVHRTGLWLTRVGMRVTEILYHKAVTGDLKGTKRKRRVCAGENESYWSGIESYDHGFVSLMGGGHPLPPADGVGGSLSQYGVSSFNLERLYAAIGLYQDFHFYRSP